MNRVLFKDAIGHVLRISHDIAIPGAHRRLADEVGITGETRIAFC
jgi:hypothetical protein